MFHNNYELCSGNHIAFVQHLTDILICNDRVTSLCIKCLKALAVVGNIPVHRNQQKILQILVAEHGDCLQEMQHMPSLPECKRQQLCAIVDLICVCCIESNAALAQGLVPLPWLLKILQKVNGLDLMEEQASLLHCLTVVWWAWRGVSGDKDKKWWDRTQSWWDIWWRVVQCLDEQIREWSSKPPITKDDDYVQHVLDAIIPCLATFFTSCGKNRLNYYMDENNLAQTRSIASSLHTIYQGTQPDRKQVCPCPPFPVCMCMCMCVCV